MNEILQRIEALRKAKKKNVTQLCKEVGIAQSTYATWLRGDRIPRSDKIQLFAKYFGVDANYIMTGKKDWQPKLTKKDERDIKNAIEAIKNQLSTGTGLMYDGEPLDEESQEAILAAIEVAERTAILEAKKRYTPKKYRE
ncbi:transcriptional repressor DicA [uncultured Eubacterium sp.]|uniref:helix-turn-helix domain-containing protein n=1 Tax=Brotomerdimonas butyrica TaxID=2981721 RepID=UPI0008207532|nr:helix-turn-helix transcriptional regulator [Brotomerdimonas butyrica]MCU6756398.1 helix-turn-helix domain-containing protein [Brotomerdimonas butyrica]SCH82062.1 transcriptional repressor DicA [uncultured Eubacterium sp.]